MQREVMLNSIGKLILGFICLFLKTTAPLHNTPFFKSIFRWYRNTGITTIQKFIPLFGNFVMVSLTTRCQCSCQHCGVGYQRGHGGFELDKTEVYGIIDEINKSGAHSIYFFGGEPLLIPELPGFIAYAGRKGLRTRFDTNGLLLDEEMVVRLKKAGLDEVGISIDSFDEKIHDKNRGVEGTFKKALSGISYCKKHNLTCYISTVATKLNLRNGDFQKIIQMAKGSGNKVRVLSPVHCGQWENRKDVALTPEEVQLLRSFLERGKVFWDSELVDTKDSPFLCSAIAGRTFYISPFGDIQPCSYFPIQFGNIRQEPLAAILKRMRNSRLYSEGEKYSDCPTNSIHFQKRSGRRTNTHPAAAPEPISLQQ
jgi:MoaA/NifB/PqqE/SkfB family radical SAM enzyme